MPKLKVRPSPLTLHTSKWMLHKIKPRINIRLTLNYVDKNALMFDLHVGKLFKKEMQKPFVNAFAPKL